MAEQDRQNKKQSKAEQPSKNTAGKQPSGKKLSEKKAKAKKPAPQATLQSWDVELSAHSVALLHYWREMPPSAQDRPREEPPRHVPVVPCGHYEEDEDKSPPVQFEKPESPLADEEACDKTGACGDAEPQ